MLFSRLPLSLLTLTCAIDTILADIDNVEDVKTVDIFAVNYPIVAYILDSDSGHHQDDATTYIIACPSDMATSSCDFAQPYTLIQGSATISFEFTATLPTTTSAAALTQSFTLGCKLDSTTSMGCSATGLADDVDTPVTTSQTFSYTGTQAQAFFKPVSLVTKTEDLLTHTPGSSNTGISAKPTVTAGVFQVVKAEVATTTATSAVASPTGILVASATPSTLIATKSAASASTREAKDGVFYAGLLLAGVLGMVLL